MAVFSCRFTYKLDLKQQVRCACKLGPYIVWNRRLQ